jgi:hypothetical protein
VATEDELVALAWEHFRVEQAGDMAATLATLEDDPVYEFQPVGRGLRGMDAVTRYYDFFFNGRVVEFEDSQIRNSWVTEQGLGFEFAVHARLPDRSLQDFALCAILTFGRHKLTGERLYASEEFFRHLMGPVFDETVPIAELR